MEKPEGEVMSKKEEPKEHKRKYPICATPDCGKKVLKEGLCYKCLKIKHWKAPYPKAKPTPDKSKKTLAPSLQHKNKKPIPPPSRDDISPQPCLRPYPQELSIVNMLIEMSSRINDMQRNIDTLLAIII
jgi:hypothetical protein